MKWLLLIPYILTMSYIQCTILPDDDPLLADVNLLGTDDDELNIMATVEVNIGRKLGLAQRNTSVVLEEVNKAGPTAFTVLNQLDESDRGAVKVLKTFLQKYNLTADRFFSIRTKKGISVRSKLPIIGKFMEDTIRENFDQRNITIVYRLLGKCADLLLIARVGCYGYPCGKISTVTMSGYSSLMYAAGRLSKDAVRGVLRLLYYYRYALKYEHLRKKIMKWIMDEKCIPMAKEYADKYEELGNLAGKVKEKLFDTMNSAKDTQREAVSRL